MNLLTLLPPGWFSVVDELLYPPSFFRIIPMGSDNVTASLAVLGPNSISLSPREMSRSMCHVQGDLNALFMLRKKITGSWKLVAIFLQKGAGWDVVWYRKLDFTGIQTTSVYFWRQYADGYWSHSNGDWPVPLDVGYREINGYGEGEAQSLTNAQERKIASLTKGQQPCLLPLLLTHLSNKLSPKARQN